MKILAGSIQLKEEGPIRVLAPNRLRVGRKTAALGLLWQPVRSQISLREQAGMAGGHGGEFDLAASFGDGQLGFGMKSEGLAAGMFAGASLFDADAMGGTWLAAFPLDGGQLWWIVAMRDAKIYEDRVLDDGAAARAALVKSLEAPDWERIIAPTDWGIEKSEQVDLSELVSIKRATRLRLVDRSFQIGTGIALAAIVATVLAYAWVQFSKYWDEEKLRAEAVERSQTVANAEQPWRNSPHVSDFVSVCVSQMERATVLAPGWTPQPLICRWSKTEAKLDASWSRKSGRIPHLRGMVENRTGRRIELAGKGESASLTVPITFPSSAVQADLWPAWRIESVLRERFQTLGLDLNLTARVLPPGTSGAGGGGTRFRNRHDLGVATSVSIKEYARLLSDVPALVPESLVFRPKTNVWQLTAKVYHADLRPAGIQ